MRRAVNALVLAGARSSHDALADSEGKKYKALIEIKGKPMLAHVLDALEASSAIKKIAVAAPADMALGKEIVTLPTAKTPAQTVRLALNQLATDEDLLVTTADHPLLSAAMVKKFIERANTQADANAALVPLSVVRAAYHNKRTGFHLSDDSYSSCNLFLFSGKRAEAIVSFWEKIESQRKRPWRMAMTIGLMTALRYGLGRLSLAQALQRLEKRTQTTLHAVMMGEPEAAIDVDKIEDLALVRKIMGEINET